MVSEPVKSLEFCCISPAPLTCTQYFQNIDPNVLGCFAVPLLMQREYGSKVSILSSQWKTLIRSVGNILFKYPYLIRNTHLRGPKLKK